MKSIIVTALSLFLICAVAAGVLAGVNAVTAPTIEANAAAAADKARGRGRRRQGAGRGRSRGGRLH